MNDFISVRQSLLSYPRSIIHDVPSGFRRAAVLVPFYLQNGEIFILLTRRTETVASHKGQVAFPGGAEDPNDSDAIATALRETEEELGIHRSAVEVISSLNDRLTISDFVVTPVCGFITEPLNGVHTLQNDEIARVFFVPLSFFLDPANVRVEVWERMGSTFRLYFWKYDGETIWGMTGLILAELIKAIRKDDELLKVPVSENTMEDFMKSFSR